MDPINKAAGEVVREAIHAANLTQTNVRNKAHISSTSWKHRINGTRPFTLAQLAAVAEACKVNATDLVTNIIRRAA